MSSFRLNGWNRVGIILSVIWFFVGGFWGNNIGIHAGDWTLRNYKFCLEFLVEHGVRTDTQCFQAFSRQYEDAIKGHWWLALIIATIPIPLGWGLICALTGLVRWVHRGFSGPKSPDTI